MRPRPRRFDSRPGFPEYTERTTGTVSGNLGGEQMSDRELAPMTLSENAARRIRYLTERENRPDAAVRVAVRGGGCAGFQYGFDLDTAVAEDDFVFERDGARIVVDPLSLSFLQGSEVDYAEELIGAAFQITIPNAASSCSCGTSFAV